MLRLASVAEAIVAIAQDVLRTARILQRQGPHLLLQPATGGLDVRPLRGRLARLARLQGVEAMAHTGRLAERVTVTMPVDLIAEAVRNELQRRQRLELMRSLEAPHPRQPLPLPWGWPSGLRACRKATATCSIPPQASPSGGLQRLAGRREIDEPFSRHIVTRRSGAHPRS